MPRAGRVVRGLVIGLVAAMVLAYLGAFGTGLAPFGQRLAYWAMAIMPGSVLGIAITALVRGWGGLARWRWAEVVLVAVAVSIPHTFLVIVASALFFGMGAITPGVVINFWGAVAVLALVLTAITALAEGGAPAQADPPALTQPEPAPEPAETQPQEAGAPVLPAIPPLLADRLPPALRAGRLIAMEAEDHYLRFYTDTGSDLVLMRLGDACALVPDSAGARVHRSWWVARAAVTGRTVSGSRMDLTLRGGITAPVSRAMQPVIREAGWGNAPRP
jgi:DNA-binding LytR/AlgR family response regulator